MMQRLSKGPIGIDCHILTVLSHWLREARGECDLSANTAVELKGQQQEPSVSSASCRWGSEQHAPCPPHTGQCTKRNGVNTFYTLVILYSFFLIQHYRNFRKQRNVKSLTIVTELFALCYILQFSPNKYAFILWTVMGTQKFVS